MATRLRCWDLLVQISEDYGQTSVCQDVSARMAHKGRMGGAAAGLPGMLCLGAKASSGLSLLVKIRIVSHSPASH